MKNNGCAEKRCVKMSSEYPTVMCRRNRKNSIIGGLKWLMAQRIWNYVLRPRIKQVMASGTAIHPYYPFDIINNFVSDAFPGQVNVGFDISGTGIKEAQVWTLPYIMK